MIKIYTVLFVLFMSFTGCSSNSSPNVLATVWIEGAQGGPYRNSILFEVRDNKTVRQITNGVSYDFITNKVYTNEDSKTEILKLSSADTALINELINKIGGKDAKEIIQRMILQQYMVFSMKGILVYLL